ncbi:MAG: GGDEF domain-containing protein [Deltaproteobacteria bacterium]|nr:GGDEF domain-containing protein [Deltaproteobacteria bacterium]
MPDPGGSWHCLDPVTGLYREEHFNVSLAHETARSFETEKPLAALLIRSEGEPFPKDFMSGVLKKNLRETDLPSILETGEIAVIMPRVALSGLGRLVGKLGAALGGAGGKRRVLFGAKILNPNRDLDRILDRTIDGETDGEITGPPPGTPKRPGAGKTGKLPRGSPVDSPVESPEADLARRRAKKLADSVLERARASYAPAGDLARDLANLKGFFKTEDTALLSEEKESLYRGFEGLAKGQREPLPPGDSGVGPEEKESLFEAFSARGDKPSRGPGV